MAATQRDVKQRIDSVRNIRKITRAMEMVAAARLRRAEQRIAALRPYAGAIRRMTRQAAEAAGSEISNLPILKQHESENRVAILLVTADRGLAGAFNSQDRDPVLVLVLLDRKSTRLNSSHPSISYAVFC